MVYCQLGPDNSNASKSERSCIVHRERQYMPAVNGLSFKFGIHTKFGSVLFSFYFFVLLLVTLSTYVALRFQNHTQMSSNFTVLKLVVFTL